MITLTDDSPMPFGKYKDCSMMHVPVDYLHHLWHQMSFKTKTQYEPVAAYIKENLSGLKSEDRDLIWS